MIKYSLRKSEVPLTPPWRVVLIVAGVTQLKGDFQVPTQRQREGHDR